MNSKVTGITMALLGVAGLLYSIVGIFYYQIARNPLVGVAFVAMFLVFMGAMKINNAINGLQADANYSRPSHLSHSDRKNS